MSIELLERLEQWKGRFGGPEDGQLERLLRRVARSRFRDAAHLGRLHETLLFLRAYPRTEEVARLADEALFSFADRLAEADPDYFENAEISGIAGTSLCAVFTYEVARQLAARHPHRVEIAWDRYDEQDRLGPLLTRFLPMLKEDWPVEAHVPFPEWVAAAHARGSDLQWLLAKIATLPAAARAEAYESAQVPILWRLGASAVSRSKLRLPVRDLYLHTEPLLRRSEVSIERELHGPPLPVRKLKPASARRILETIVDTSAMRYRELYGFSHPDEDGVYHAAAGRGVDIYFFGVPPSWRLPLRTYHGGMFFKNGVPAGYVEVLSLFERMEVGFNLYYTFREGESAWLYARLLRLFHQLTGVTCFSVDPYQIGHENEEAVESGAFWFYRKLGFRPTDAAVARVLAREEARMRATPGYRSSSRTLRQLAEGYILYELPGTESGDWDRFSVRRLAQALEKRKVKRSRAEWIRLGTE